MIYGLYSIFDKRAGFHGNIQIVLNDDMAERQFLDLIATADGSSPLALHPEDFRLYQLGHIDLETGQILDNNVLMLCEGGGGH